MQGQARDEKFRYNLNDFEKAPSCMRCLSSKLKKNVAIPQ